MNQQIADENKPKLEAEQKKLLTILGHMDTKDGAGEFPGDFKPKFEEVGREEGENASEVENYANDLGETNVLEERLNKVNAALQKIKDGTYGMCSGGDEIEEDRLRAVPEADTCMKHSK